MLSDYEKKNCQKLLEELNDADLNSLAHTITQNALAIESRHEAVEAIVEYSSSADELFHRQKLKKEHLKDYLMKVCKSRHLQLVAKSDKESLIKLTKEIWKEEKEKIDEKQTRSTIDELHSKPDQSAYTKEIGVAFIQWFYKMLNSLNDCTKSTDWGPFHFWTDAKLHFYIEQPDENQYNEVYGPNDVCEQLLRFILNHQVFFNPNLDSHGVYSEMNCHGLLLIKSAGTLHKGSVVVGLYEQKFGLIKDPMADGNWKIKNTELKIRLNYNCDKKAISFT